MKLLNLGCGSHFHPSWTNIDFESNSEGVIAHNLLEGIPFDDQLFDIVYHSHVLEHFSKADGERFLQECYRVLGKNGIIRVAVPDLQRIAKDYLKNLENATSGDKEAIYDYEWIKLELYDQTVRSKSGGGMKDYLFQESIPNEDYVYSRIGLEGKRIRESYLEQKPKIVTAKKSKWSFNFGKYFYFSNYRNKLKQLLLSDLEKKAIKVGLFRLGGEIHQWMYDEYSLGQLLSEVGFTKIKVCRADESNIPNWNDYQLDIVDGEVRKPDSLFMEAIKE